MMQWQCFRHAFRRCLFQIVPRSVTSDGGVPGTAEILKMEAESSSVASAKYLLRDTES